MLTYYKKGTLSFGVIKILKEDLAEVIVDPGVVFTVEMVQEYHSFLLNNLTWPFCLLINKIHNYTYDPAASKQIANLHQIRGMAVIDYNSPVKKFNTKSLIAQDRSIAWNIKIFNNRSDAITWLKTLHGYNIKKPAKLITGFSC